MKTFGKTILILFAILFILGLLGTASQRRECNEALVKFYDGHMPPISRNPCGF